MPKPSNHKLTDLDIENTLDLINEIPSNGEEARQFHWAFTFEVKYKFETEEERKEFLKVAISEFENIGDIGDDIMWTEDELIVEGGPDARECIPRLEAYVHDPNKYGAPIEGFRLTGLTLASVAKVCI